MTEQDEQKIDRNIANKARVEGAIKARNLARLLSRDDACSKSLPKLMNRFSSINGNSVATGTYFDKWWNTGG